MQKLVVKLNSLNDNKQKPMKAVSSLQGIVSMEVNESKITIIGDIDPILAVKKLRKWGPTIETVGPAKEDKKPATDGGNNGQVLTVQEQINAMYYSNLAPPYAYNTHYYAQQPYYVQSYEENPNTCVIS